MSVIDKLEYLEDTKELIRQAIINKGVEVEQNEPFANYASKINDISSGEEDLTGQQMLAFMNGAYSGKVIDSQGLIKSLYAYQFNYNSLITEIDLPECSIIGSYFSTDYQYITNVTGYEFNNCINVSRINLPKLTNMVGAYNFQGCAKLEEINLDSFSSTYLLEGTFQNCHNLKELNLPTVNYLSPSAFCNCSNLSNLTLSSDLKEIWNFAFYNCENLSHISFTSTNNIYIHANGCNRAGFTELNISTTGKLVLSVSAFGNCSKLERITIRTGSRSTLASYVFYNCSRLSYFNWIIGENDPLYLYYSMFERCSILKWEGFRSMNISAVYAYAFSRCSALDYVYLSNCNTLSQAAFQQCSNISYVYIPKISNIYTEVFSSCYNLESVYLMQESGLSNIPVLSNSNAFYSAGYSTSLGHPMIYVGYEEYLSMLQEATNWTSVSSWISVSQFVEV